MFVGVLQVYKAEWNDYQQVAVKQLKQHDARNDIRFLREIAILKECRSTNVVQFLVRAIPSISIGFPPASSFRVFSITSLLKSCIHVEPSGSLGLTI